MQNDYEKANNFYYYSRCNSIGKENYTEIGEKLSDTLFCFMSSLVKSSLTEEVKSKYSNEKAICYEVIQCDNTLKHYTIKIGETEFTCKNGNNIESYEIEGFEGTITCPPYDRICSGTELCNDLYDCVKKKIETDYQKESKSVSIVIPDIEFSFESFKGTLKDYLDKCENIESLQEFLEQFISKDNSSLFNFFKIYDFIIFIFIFIL